MYNVATVNCDYCNAPWISVLDRLPKSGEKVLVSTDTEVLISIYQGEQFGFTCGLVDAWMPLPTLYSAC